MVLTMLDGISGVNVFDADGRASLASDYFNP